MPGTREDVVVKAFDPIGKYRVRLLESTKGVRSLDIREYIEADTFEGFTRRGIRLGTDQVVELRAILNEVTDPAYASAVKS